MRRAAAAALLFCAALSSYDDVPDQIDPDDCAAPQDALARSLAPQPGLPTVPHPPGNPPTAEKIALGRKLFFDRRLSINGTMSCAMCHVPEQGFANHEMQTAIGVEGRSGRRNAPTILNTGFLARLFHDGRDPALETQFLTPLLARHEMANPSAGHVIALLNGLPDYRALFRDAFGAPASVDRMGMALAVWQRSLVAGDAPFDRWFYLGDDTALSEAQKRGHALFAGRAGCASCHVIGESDALFTDQMFHDTGYGWMRERQRQRGSDVTRVQVAPGVYHDLGRDRLTRLARPRAADLGRYEVTEDPADRWRFRTPSLRNIAVTRPYMHDGGLPDLAAVIAFYNDGGPGHPDQDARIAPLGLEARDMADLEAFLISLTSPDLPCLAAGARGQPRRDHAGADEE